MWGGIKNSNLVISESNILDQFFCLTFINQYFRINLFHQSFRWVFLCEIEEKKYFEKILKIYLQRVREILLEFKIKSNHYWLRHCLKRLNLYFCFLFFALVYFEYYLELKLQVTMWRVESIIFDFQIIPYRIINLNRR